MPVPDPGMTLPCVPPVAWCAGLRAAAVDDRAEGHLDQVLCLIPSHWSCSPASPSPPATAGLTIRHRVARSDRLAARVRHVRSRPRLTAALTRRCGWDGALPGRPPVGPGFGFLSPGKDNYRASVPIVSAITLRVWSRTVGTPSSMARESGSRWQRVALLGFGLGGLVVLVVLWNKAPALYQHARDPGGAVATTRAGILTAMAGLIAFTGVMLNLAETRRTNELTRVRDEQARERDRLTLEEGRRSNEQARERDRLTHERERAAQLADRYTAAVTQLGSDTLDVRLGGLYALERIAVDSPVDHRTVVAVLSAFVREHTISGRPRRPRRRRAALTVLGRLPARDGVLRADITGADLGGADLTEANLAGATLTAVRGLTREQLEAAAGDGDTVLPAGWVRPAS